MKTTKHIKQLAKKLHIQHALNSNYPMSAECYEEYLEIIKRAILGDRFYASVESVSRSGMSRVIKLGYVLNNQFFIIRNPQILALACCDKNGRIGGCGMDMLYHAQYSLFHALHKSYKQAHYQKRMPTYRSF